MDTEDSYHLALGRFMDQYATNEAITQSLLWREAGIEAPAAQAIFSGTRTQQALQFIRRLYAATGRTLDKNLERGMSHLAALTDVRNSIMHWGMRPMDQGFVISNMFFAHLPERRREFTISSGDLDAMRQDLVVIQTTMMLRLTECGWGSEHSEFLGTDRGKQLLQLARSPWLYTPPP